MQTLITVLRVAAIIYILVYIILAICTKKPIKTLLQNALLGFLALAAVGLTAKFTGVHIPLNPYSVSTCVAGGIPAVIALLLLRMIFGL